VPGSRRHGVAVFEARLSKRVIPRLLVGEHVCREQCSQRRPMCQPLGSRNFLQVSFRFQERARALDERLGSQQNLSVKMSPWRRQVLAFSDETRVARDSNRSSFRELFQNPVGGEPTRCNGDPGSSSVAAPSITARVCHGSCANRVEHDVACQFQQVTVAIDQDGLEPSLQ